ncbi:Glycoside hydrolase, family 2, immunoglobulin-like beta-sandwich [Penicillium griseofulvum]|uniref:Glycoside hydrolase, family 2, immunoglobulin-like beta-sandwich n=1 Tax=Penicillium patulum TaxID=5078 RepID=A0A135LDK9_PENPA|nr:Glycoside hydrolase, family 2, immunoglobulin-like beta-sandwich [Penicillium griseofulvum]KXG47047.1 Glycoside hydrolase, family 2, immunoglobulin-like beta-sandwich [Penicillium griseofulvum]
MHLAQSFVLLCLVATGIALPTNEDIRTQELKARGPGYSPKQPPLTTPWTNKVGTKPWPEYPRPLLERSAWKNLNGVWKYQSAASLDAVQQPPFGQELAQEVLIPSCLESGLSGIQTDSAFYSWFSTSFKVSPSWKGEQVLLNFGAVDYEATVFVNGQKAGFHRGGYFRFALDVTKYLKFDQQNELLVFVHDPTDDGDYVIPIGKQTLRPSHIFYTPCSGIWQTVWLEAAPANHITKLDLDANMDGQISITVHSSATDKPANAEVTVHKNGKTIATHKGPTNKQFQFKVSSPKLWSPDSPNLYNVTVKLGKDKVESYVGFRTISRGKIDGVERPLLNGKFIFMFGTLDQGYWPDGLYTPPSKEAMVYDLKMLKKLGFNMVRKHIKVETDLFYRACDELGLLVIQDMPSLRPSQSRRGADGNFHTILPDEKQQAEFARQLDLLVNQLKSFPSVATWVVYNEAWGQISNNPEFELTERVRQLDPTRLVDSTSGWDDHGAGDFSDNHHYANPQCGTPFYSLRSSPHDPSRIGFQGEFGGIGTNVSIDHLWNNQKAIDTIDQTYELDETIEAWNYRSHLLLNELEDQVRLYACSGGVWTQTTDVEGEVNGLITYDRRVSRVNEKQWQADIKALYDAAAARSKA